MYCQKKSSQKQFITQINDEFIGRKNSSLAEHEI